DEGYPRGKTTLVEKGVLKAFIHNTSTAKRAETTTTGNAGIVTPQTHNIVFELGSQSFDELLAECSKSTIYVTAAWYLRYTSQREGLFSIIPRDGMFLIENGEIKSPIRELRISGNMIEMLQNVVAMANDQRQVRWWDETPGPVFVPHTLIKDVTFTSGTR
ncbi:MAG: metallopeptidase TldD-related protein, partial [Candidatus Hodarchaeota archaeon]